jgi:hypothetical protein
LYKNYIGNSFNNLVPAKHIRILDNNEIDEKVD